MANIADPDSQSKKRGLLLPVLIGLVLAGGAGAGGFWVVGQGFFSGGTDDGGDDGGTDQATPSYTAVAFVPLETLTISLGGESSGRFLIVTAQLEVPPEHQAEVTGLTPRVLDVLNSYLRVISVTELSEPTSLMRLRAQMLRRVQVVTGTGRVRDLLITQFVVN
jgi:flagellar FliL protein